MAREIRIQRLQMGKHLERLVHIMCALECLEAAKPV